MPISLRPATAGDVLEFSAWRYPPPFDVYDLTEGPDEAVAYFTSPEVRCHVLVEDGNLVGFCTFGEDGRVPGGDYSAEALDVGIGIDPALAGRGRGREWLDAVTAHARTALGADRLRVTVAAGNQRALRAARAAGFVETARFTSTREVLGTAEFVVLELPLIAVSLPG